MSEGSEILKRSVEATMKAIDDSKGASGVCGAHRAVAEGVYVLLMCKQYELDRPTKINNLSMGWIATICGIISVGVSVIAVWIGK